MEYLYYISCLRYTILVGNPRLLSCLRYTILVGNPWLLSCLRYTILVGNPWLLSCLRYTILVGNPRYKPLFFSIFLFFSCCCYWEYRCENKLLDTRKVLQLNWLVRKLKEEIVWSSFCVPSDTKGNGSWLDTVFGFCTDCLPRLQCSSFFFKSSALLFM